MVLVLYSFFAAHYNNISIIKFLIKRGADVNNQGTPMKRAAVHIATVRGHIETVKILLEHGAVYNLPDATGKTPEGLAKIYYRKNIATLLSSTDLITELRKRKLAQLYIKDIKKKKIIVVENRLNNYIQTNADKHSMESYLCLKRK